MADKSKVIAVEIVWSVKPISVAFIRHIERPVGLNRHIYRNQHKITPASYNRLMPLVSEMAKTFNYSTLISYGFLDKGKERSLNEL
jgi:hypothetical protein